MRRTFSRRAPRLPLTGVRPQVRMHGSMYGQAWRAKMGGCEHRKGAWMFAKQGVCGQVWAGVNRY